ncbi:hypothetical protein AO382_0789 [Moraxella catarrhalis]|uniref:Uncharacterized protein n=1 Tax=Moraxella catarrhalis TaxID=480 RepID=A0A7Z1A4C8_MORCA|nr:hypothetical protein AO382_0789 [Moraxella catarrhalis]
MTDQISLSCIIYRAYRIDEYTYLSNNGSRRAPKSGNDIDLTTVYIITILAHKKKPHPISDQMRQSDQMLN